MPILLRLNTRTTSGLLGVLIGLAGLVPGLGLASMTISDPVGVHSIGKAIDLKSTVSGIPSGAESQLRTTCLRARILPMGSTETQHEALDVQVDFQPTIRQGGLLEIRTIAAVSHAVVKLELASECPLVIFNTTWTLIMEEHTFDATKPQIQNSSQQKVPSFDLASSALLKNSRQAPTRPQTAYVPARAAVSEEPAKPDAAIKTTNEQEVIPEEVKTNPPEAVKLASLDQSLMNNGLIESQHTELAIGSGLSFGQIEQAPGKEIWPLHLLFPIGALILLVLALLALWARRQNNDKRTSAISVVKVNAEPVLASTQTSELILTKNNDHPGMNRVLESLMGGEEGTFDHMPEAIDSYIGDTRNNASDKQSLRISLEMSNRADISRWNLPSNYQSLVEDRNNSLETLRNTEALILRCHIGVVELAFQESIQGQTMSAETPNELLQFLLGHRVYEVEDMPTLNVPDILKSYVKAKACDVVGAENRQVFRENLLSLNTHVNNQAMCFHTNAWREFLSEEGLLS